MSTSSTASDSCSSRSSAGSNSPEHSRYHPSRGDNHHPNCGGNASNNGDEKNGADTISLLSGCVECVTLVSVPDNQVITQGVNHRCAIPKHAKTNDVVNQLRTEIHQLRSNLRLANATIAQLQTGTALRSGSKSGSTPTTSSDGSDKTYVIFILFLGSGAI